jgi:Uma2 family endonuclease
MTAAKPTTEANSRWPVPPPDGWTVDDLETLPDLPPHTELIDGSLVFVSPQRWFHAAVINLLFYALENAAPPDMLAVREMAIVIDKRNGPEPDLAVVRDDVFTDIDQAQFPASDVLLAVEVVSPDSESRDRDTKPNKYAAAGIPHYWLVEKGPEDNPTVHVYQRDATSKKYVLTGTYRDRLTVQVPFDIDVDLTTLRRPRARG